MVANILPAAHDLRPPPIPLTLEIEPKCQILSFSEHGHRGVKIQLFHNMVMLHHELKRITNANSNLYRTWSFCISNKWNQVCSNMVANISPADPGDRVKRSTFSFCFQNIAMLHIKQD